MPLNDFPSAKPTYDFYDTVTAGRTVLANGILVSRQANPPDTLFPHGSVTWHWHMAGRVASYLVENSVGHYQLTKRIVDGRPFYQAQASSLSPKRKAKNRKIMNLQPDITAFEARFNGPFPFSSDGVVVGRPSASFEEEMVTMITFAGGRIDTDTLYHENMHQWWGDHVTEADYHLTFFKEGLATLGEFLFGARKDAARARRAVHPGRPPGLRGLADQRLQRVLHHHREELLAARPVRPDAVPAVRRQQHLPAAGHQLHRPAAHPRAGPVRPGAGPATAAVRRRLDHRGTAGGRVRALAAEPERGLPGPADDVLPAVVGHRLPARRRPAPAADHRSRAGRPQLLRGGRLHSLTRLASIGGAGLG